MPPGGRAALTFDDGPGPAPDETPAVLDALEAAGARATFFLVGEQVNQTPGLVREIIDRGHEVGVHGRSHFRHDLAPVAKSVADIEAGHALVVEATGGPARFYRPPYGRLTPAGGEACRRLGMEIAYWSTWGLDWEPLSGRRIARRVLREFDDGGIVLLHDSARYAPRASARETARAIAAIADRAAALGVELVTLAEACDGTSGSSAR